MLWRSVAALSLASAALVDEVLSQVVTITEHASVCSAVYTTGSRSVTVVQSTVMVEPLPWTDPAANSGTPFVLQVQGDAQQAQVQAWLTANGNTTTDSTQATQYKITDGELSTVGGATFSTSPNTAYQPLAVMSLLGSITTTFIVKGGVMEWTNTDFEDGTASFYKSPASLANNAQVIARFSGAVDPSWSPVVLKAMPGMQCDDYCSTCG